MRTTWRLIAVSAALLTVPSYARSQEIVQGGEDLFHFTPLDYPSHFREQKVQGTIVIDVTLDAKGHVLDARVVDGPLLLRKMVLRTVLDWHFAPVKEGTTTRVAVRYQLPMSTGPNPKGLYNTGPRPVGFLASDLRRGVVKAIDVSELSDRMKRELTARMPVREGQSVAELDWVKIQQAIWEIDEHLELKLTVAAPGSPTPLALKLFHPRTSPFGAPPPPPPPPPGIRKQ